MNQELLSFRKILPQQEEEMKMEKEGIIPLEKLHEMALSKEQPRKKVLLVDGNITESRYEDDEYHLNLTNLGIERIAGYLKKFGVKVDVVRLQGLADKEKLQKLILEADIIGMSALSTSIQEAFDFCAEIKQKHPEKITIGGAEHFALDAEWILKHPEVAGVDVCCLSQGELPLLALSLGVSVEEIGSIAYRSKKSDSSIEVHENSKFPRLKENSTQEILKPVSAEITNDKQKMPFMELDNFFENAGSTTTSTGCAHNCTFCTSKSFYGAPVSCLETAKTEIESMNQQGKDFVFFRDAMLNLNPKHLTGVIDFMKKINSDKERKVGWICFMDAKEDKEMQQFEDLAEAGCIMVAVGKETIMGSRKDYNKGASLEVATKFTETAKEFVLVRDLLILGLADDYEHTREEIKQGMLDYMKKHPQGLFRINVFTPIVGTPDFKKYGSMYADGKDPRDDVSQFKKHDTMHGVIDPEKMYVSLPQDVSQEKRWVKKPEDWESLRDEIMEEYLNSPEHNAFLENLKNKESLGRKGLLYGIAKDFQKLTIEGIARNKK